ncbi:hypothetical protein FHT44_005154 [Mycolicibacterium sp. BK634]|nr:hypothetical protein [Mycolicibacterium sp. BK634]
MRSKTASLPTAGATMDCGCVITAKLEQLERCGIDFGTTIASAQMMKPCTQHGGKTLCELGHTQDSCPNWLEALCVCTHPACDRS